MRKIVFFLLVGLATLIIPACGAQAIYGVTPAPDKLTFQFFYTENWAPWAAMEPVVNGLEETYKAQIVFEWIDAASKEGQTFFRFYGLPGHPGFILLNPEGEVLWKGFGEQNQEFIASNIDTALENRQTSPWMIHQVYGVDYAYQVIGNYARVTVPILD